MATRYWVAVFGDIAGLRWVLEHSRMAFSEAMANRASAIRAGDGLLLYVSRGAFHNPTRDESQVVGVTRIESAAIRLSRPVEIAGREFVIRCDLSVETCLPEREGVAIKTFVKRLDLVKRPEVWGQYFRQGLVSISRKDFETLGDAIRRTFAAQLN